MRLAGNRTRASAAVCVMVLGGCWSSPAAAPPAPVGRISAPAAEETAFDELLGLMRERLLLMHDVARWKWNEGKPVTDADRERQLLAELERSGERYGLTRGQTKAFMAAQIEAGKLVQEADFATWKEQGQGKFNDVRDLNTELRPLIDELSDRLLSELAKSVPIIDDEQARTRLDQRANVILRGQGIDEAVRTAAIHPLRSGFEGRPSEAVP